MPGLENTDELFDLRMSVVPERGQIDGTMRGFALRPYYPSPRRVDQPAALP